MFSKLILFLPQTSANVDQTSLLNVLDPRMSQLGVQTKKFLLAPRAGLFYSLPHSQNGGAAGDCDGLLSRLCSSLLVAITPKILAAPNRRIWHSGYMPGYVPQTHFSV